MMVRIPVLSFVLCALPVSVWAQDVVTPDPALATRLAVLEKAIEAKRTDTHAPGAALVIIKDDKIIYLKGFGYKDIETQEPITANTMFAIGSSSKAFTALTVMMSKDDGKLKLTDSPRKYLPYFALQDPDANAKITISDLLCHKSGLDRTDLFWYTGKLNKKEIIQNVANCKPTAKLGEKFQYQNVMFLTAGETVAAAQKQSWESFLHKRVLNPLGMKNSTLSIRSMVETPDHATGYQTSGDPKVDHKMPYHDIGCIAPAGAINSNLKDMAQWVRFMLNGGTVNGKRLVSEESFKEIVSPQMEIAGPVKYGYGWFLRDWKGHKVIEHGGNIDGFSTAVALMPDQHLGFVMLCNQNNSPLPPASLEIIWKSLLGTPDDTKSIVAVTPTVKSEDEAGNYTFQDKLTIAVTSKEGKLTAKIAGQPALPLIPVGGRKYKLSDPAPDGFFVTFRPNEKDPKIAEMFLEQPGVKIALTKKSAGGDTVYKAPLTVEELQSKVISALGGEAALRKHTSSIIKANITMEAQGMTGKGTLYSKAPNLSTEHSEFFALKKRIFYQRDWCDGKTAAEDTNIAPTTLKSGKALANRVADAAFNEPLNWKTLYKSVVIKGEEKIGDESVYVVVKTPEGGDPITDYISTKTFLTLKRDSIMGSDEDSVPVSETFADYKPVDGVLVSFRRVRKSVASEVITMVEKVEWNPKINDAVFRVHR